MSSMGSSRVSIGSLLRSHMETHNCVQLQTKVFNLVFVDSPRTRHKHCVQLHMQAKHAYI